MMSGLPEGQTYQLQLEYTRENDTSVITTPGQVEPIDPVDENTEGRSTLNNLPLFLGVFGAALIVIAVVYFIRGQPARTAKPRKRPQRSQEAGSQIYCHECGTRAQEGDRFCRTCGSRLRAN